MLTTCPFPFQALLPGRAVLPYDFLVGAEVQSGRALAFLGAGVPDSRRVQESARDQYTPAPYAGLLRQTRNSPVSAEFEAKVCEGLDSLPPVVCTALKTNGWDIHLATFLTEANPRLKGVNPRGSDPWATADHSGAVCIPPHIYMGEKKWVADPKGPSKLSAMRLFPKFRLVEPEMGTAQGRLAVNIAPDRTIRHEVGHAVDALLQRPSGSSGFQQVYIQDLKKLSPMGRDRFYYYIQPGTDNNPTLGGKREAFAEAFASLYGGGDYQTELFRQAFPDTIRFVQKTVQDWENRKGRLPSAWDNGPPAGLGAKAH